MDYDHESAHDYLSEIRALCHDLRVESPAVLSFKRRPNRTPAVAGSQALVMLGTEGGRH